MSESEVSAKAPNLKRMWWCNQAKSYEESSKRGELWAAPKEWHHKTLRELEDGDVVLNYSKGQLRGYAIARGRGKLVSGHKDEAGVVDDRLVAPVEFHEFETPFTLDDVPMEWRMENTVKERRGPFQAGGRVHLVFLVRVTGPFNGLRPLIEG